VPEVRRVPGDAHQRLLLAGYQGPDSILTAGLNTFSEALRGFSGNWQVDLEGDVTARGASAASLFKRVEDGGANICYVASGYLSSRVPELGVLDIPFSVTCRSMALAALDGAVGCELTRAVEEKTGYRVLGFWDNGFRHISNAIRPIYAAIDCEGISIRTLDSANYRAALASLGFSPKTGDVKDLMKMVSSGEVQAQENPLTNLIGFSIWQHHPFVSLTGHYFGILLLVCGQRWFGALTRLQQEELALAVRVATARQRDMAAHQDVQALGFLRDRGIDVLESPELDLMSMRSATAGVAARQCATISSPVLLSYLNQT
jgi:TRAP-type transport system periplasmic protein